VFDDIVVTGYGPKTSETRGKPFAPTKYSNNPAIWRVENVPPEPPPQSIYIGLEFFRSRRKRKNRPLLSRPHGYLFPRYTTIIVVTKMKILAPGLYVDNLLYTCVVQNLRYVPIINRT